MTLALDSWAVIAWLDGAECDRAAITDALSAGSVMSWINVVEVGYRIAREQGDEVSRQIVTSLESRLALKLPDRRTMSAVIDLKAGWPIALGDCFAIATAAASDAVLLTGDPEIVEAKGLPCRVLDVR